MLQNKQRAKYNRTLTLTEADVLACRDKLVKLSKKTDIDKILNKTICQDVVEAIDFLPDCCVDMLFADPPYNISKSFNGRFFSARSQQKYQEYIESWLCKLPRVLKPNSSVYICSDWRTSAAMQTVLSKYFTIQNRITWEREKGRGALRNWKNASEDIWFCTVGDDYTFNLDDVKLCRKVIAPYKDTAGKPKDWAHEDGEKYRLTCPSNLWTDLTVPFWSMPENTDHPTQKPEKMLAKLILASSNSNDLILDPFCGSGTTSVVAKKLGRNFIGIEIDETYCCLAEKRLKIAETDKSIQGYNDGVFYERNTKKL